MATVASVAEIPPLDEIFAAYPEIAAVYVFGSVARGEAGPDSDLDLGVVYRRFDRSGQQHARVAPALAHETGRRLGIEAVDVVDLEAQGPVFCHRALVDGRLLYDGAPQRRVDFVSDAIVRGLDFRPTWELATRGKVGALRRWIRERR